MPSYMRNKLSVKTELSLRVPVLEKQFNKVLWLLLLKYSGTSI